MKPDVDPLHPDRPNLLKGVLLFLTALCCFTLGSMTTRFVLPKVSIFMVLFVQSVVGIFFSIPWIIKQRASSLKTKRLPLITLRTLGGILGFTCNFLAVQKISLTNTVLLFNTGPLILPFVLFIWLKEKINHRLWPGIVVGFIGVICILRPNKELLVGTGALWGLGAGLCLAFNMASTRLLSRTEKPHTFLFYYFLISILLTLPGAISNPEIPDLSSWLLLLVVGLLIGIGMNIFILAFHYAKASQLSPFAYGSILFSALLDLVFFHTVPSWLSFIGAIFVIAGGLLTIYYSRIKPLAVIE